MDLDKIAEEIGKDKEVLEAEITIFKKGGKNTLTKSKIVINYYPDNEYQYGIDHKRYLLR